MLNVPGFGKVAILGLSAFASRPIVFGSFHFHFPLRCEFIVRFDCCNSREKNYCVWGLFIFCKHKLLQLQCRKNCAKIINKFIKITEIWRRTRKEQKQQIVGFIGEKKNTNKINKKSVSRCNTNFSALMDCCAIFANEANLKMSKDCQLWPNAFWERRSVIDRRSCTSRLESIKWYFNILLSKSQWNRPTSFGDMKF